MTRRGSRSVSGVWRDIVWAVASIGMAALFGLVFRDRLASADLAMLMLLAVVVVAVRSPRWLAVSAAIATIVVYDLLFVTPYYRLTVSDASYLLTFAVMLVVALAIGHLTGQLRVVALERQERERRTAARLEVTERLARAPDDRVAALTERVLSESTGAASQVLLVDETADLDSVLDRIRMPVADHGIRDALLAVWAGGSRKHQTVDGWLVHRITDGDRTWGLAVLEPDGSGGHSTEDVALVEAVLAQLSLVLERRELARRDAAAGLEIEAERLRIALLSAVSHDLRTPLAAIEGAASTLLTGSTPVPEDVRTGLLETIQDEARRMNRLIGNLLDMVRVETGALAVHRSWQPIEEVIGVALLRMDHRLGAREVRVELPADLPLVAIDELLIEHVFINLLENAVRHAPEAGPIGIRARVEGDSLVITMRDHGPGFPAELAEDPFARFRSRSTATPTDGGLGLGLAICRGIVEAHGGHLTLHNPPDGGAEIVVALPIGVAPTAPHDDETAA